MRRETSGDRRALYRALPRSTAIGHGFARKLSRWHGIDICVTITPTSRNEACFECEDEGDIGETPHSTVSGGEP